MGFCTIASVNPKGGTGKTTVAVHLAVAAHRKGQDVTLLDADPQGSVLDWDRRTEEGYDGPSVSQLGRDRTLAASLGRVESDWVVVDSPARLDDRTGRVLSNADLVLVPVRPSGLDLWGTAEFVGVLNGHVERGLSAALVGTQRDVRTSLADELGGVAAELGFPLLDGLTLRVSYARSMSQGQTVLDGADGTAAEEVWELYSGVQELV